MLNAYLCTHKNDTPRRVGGKSSGGYFWGYDFAVTEAADQPRRGRKPLPPGLAKVKRNLRLGPIYEAAEQELDPGETMTHFVEQALHHEIQRRQRARKRSGKDETPPA